MLLDVGAGLSLALLQRDELPADLARAASGLNRQTVNQDQAMIRAVNHANML